MTTAADSVQLLLREHGARYHPRYQGFLSDHAAMATTALRRLGATDSAAVAWYQNYVERLEPAEDDYLSRRQYWLQQLQLKGADAVLQQQLPGLISGWAKDAYHPIIRLAYGYEARNLEEVAAALAYFEMCGAEVRIDELAALAQHRPANTDELLSWGSVLNKSLPAQATFSEKLSLIVRKPEFANTAFVVDDNLRNVSALALRVFAASHDFFALHLVTGAHAFRLLYEYAGSARDAIFNLGLAAGYAAAGAPPLTPVPSRKTDSADASVSVTAVELLALSSVDEHHIKLAYSAAAQARHFADDDYLTAAAAYLQTSDR